MQKEHSGSKWGTTGARYSGAQLLEFLSGRQDIKTVLDFGAGKGTLGEYITSRLPRIEWTNYDPGMPEYDRIPTKQFDCVVSTDMLEHVEPDALESVLDVLSGLSRFVLYSDIACFPTGKVFGDGPYIGQDLHLIIKDPAWWREKFQRLTDLQELSYAHTEKLSKGVMKKRCILVHERA